MENIPLITGLLLAVVTIVASWKVFVKAGRPGWISIVPFYNVYVTVTLSGKPGWWLILYFIPLVNLVVHVIVSIAQAKTFGKEWLFGLGLVLLPFVFLPILAFSEAKYTAPAGPVASTPN